jgi:cysteine desulfurase/selenocysteine lyase
MADLATTGAQAKAPMAFDPARIRADFPILSTSNRFGRPLIYLDSAATSLKPRSVIDAVDGYNAAYSANIHRGIYELAEKATGLYEATREKIAKLINAPDPREVVFVRNATEAINLVAYSWGRRNIGRGDTIVLTEMEHHANLVPWQLLVQEKDGDLEFVPITDDGILRLEVFEVLLHLRPKLVAFTHVSNMLGTINPTAPRRCRTCRLTSTPSTPISTCSPVTRCSAPRAPGRSGPAASCSRPCRRSWPAAT